MSLAELVRETRKGPLEEIKSVLRAGDGREHIEVVGPMGVGKTALLNVLAEDLRPDMLIIYYNFHEIHNDKEGLRSAMKERRVAIGGQSLEYESLQETSGWLVRDLKRTGRRVTTVVDGIDHRKEDWCDLLEMNLLEPALSVGDVITARSGNTYSWDDPGLRMSHSLNLGPLNIEGTRLQMGETLSKKLNVEVVHDLAGGNPGIISKLISRPDDLKLGLDLAIDSMLNNLGGKKQEIRDAAERLLGLEGFREEDLMEMLNLNLLDIRLLRDRMVRHGIISWRESEFHLDDALSHALSKRIVMDDKPRLLDIYDATVRLWEKRRDNAQKSGVNFFEQKLAKARAKSEILRES